MTSPSGNRLTGASVVAAVGLLVAGLVTWSLSLHSIRFDQMSDIGLASVLPATTWIGMALITLSFLLALRTGYEPAIVVTILGTIVVLHGFSSIAEPTMRFVVSWRHVGITNYVATHGSVDPHIDAYFNWPGFFIFTAFLSKVSGLGDIVPVVKWAPLAYNLMYFPPLVVIGRALLDEKLLVWPAVWLFYVGNWIGQDYFSPQGLDFFVYLVVLAFLVRWFKSTADVPPWLGVARRLLPRSAWPRELKTDAGKALVPDAPSNAAQRVVLLTVILLMIAAVVPSHQLTPFALVLTTGALVAVGWCRLRGLPVIILIITLLWMVYMAVIFVAGHIGAIVDQVGALNQILGENLGGRLHGSRGHALIVHLRLAVTAVLWLAAGAGLLRRARAGKPVIGVAALALAPFPLLLIQPYGGEVLLRIGLFSLPFMALLAASLCMAPGAREISWRGTALLALLGGLLVATFPFTRFGNERMDYYSRNEVAAVRELYRIAPRGSVLVSASDALPWRFRGYADYDYRFLTGLDRRKFAARGVPADDDISIDLGTPDRALLLRQVTRRMRVGPGQRSFLIITRSQKADLDMTSPWRRGVLEHVERVLLTSSHFRVVLNRPDATILELAKRAGAA